MKKMEIICDGSWECCTVYGRLYFQEKREGNHSEGNCESNFK